MKIVLFISSLALFCGCSAQLKNVKMDSIPTPEKSIIYGKLAPRYDVTGTPTLFGIPVYECGIFLKNLTDNKVSYVKLNGKKCLV